MAKKRTNLAAINAELNALEWDPPLRRVVVKNRSRYDVKFFFPDGASLRWTSDTKRSLSPAEMVAGLMEMAELIRSTMDQPPSVGAVARPDGSSTDGPRA